LGAPGTRLGAQKWLNPVFLHFEKCRPTEEDVRQSIARIESSPFIPRKDSVRGFVYDVATGRLDEVS